jgi:hypothetical protein
MKASSGGRIPPGGTVRRSQLLFGNGPGAILDLVEDAVVVGGLDTWRYPNTHDGFFNEVRLQTKIHSLLAVTKWWPHSQVRLRLPPPCDDNEPSMRVGIPALRFPRWFVCQNGDCRSLVNFKNLDPKNHQHICRHGKGGSRKSFPVVPIRFVSACPRGHLQDIDWVRFVHRYEGAAEGGWCESSGRNYKANDPLGLEFTSPLYLLQVGTSGDLTDQVVGCRNCGATRGFQDLKGAVGKCKGWRDWLGYGATEENCEEQPRLMTRTASNIYFALTVSALSIPDPADELREGVEKIWSFLESAELGDLPIFRRNKHVGPVLERFSDSEVFAEIERRRTGKVVEAPPLRELEARALMLAPDELPGELPTQGERWFARRLRVEGLPDFLDRVVLVKALTEVRAQIGFSRIDVPSGDAEGEYMLGVETAPLGRATEWVPAVEIQGEGIFIGLKLSAVDAWTCLPAVQDRVQQFQAAFFDHNRNREGNLGLVPFPGERLVMLHTLAHMLITSISLECGYAASSIRERLYCHSEPNPMAQLVGQPAQRTTRAGILLYTGTPGSEGTLGGLVEVGRRVVHHLRQAVSMGMLCSNDPVCAQHRPDDGQEGRHREGAACHGCVLIGEPSCERRNQDLDRSLVVPTVENPDAAFLAKWVREGMR